MKAQYGIDSMPETVKTWPRTLALPAPIKMRWPCARSSAAKLPRMRAFFDGEIVPVTIPQRKGAPIVVSQDEHPRQNHR